MSIRKFINIVTERHENDSEDTLRARKLMADVTRYARSLGVSIRFKFPAFYAPEIEVTDLNAKVMGQGAGTKVMTYLNQRADEEGFNIYLHPATERNSIFYARFGYQKSDRHYGMLVRYPEIEMDDDDREEYEAIKNKPYGLNS